MSASRRKRSEDSKLCQLDSSILPTLSSTSIWLYLPLDASGTLLQVQSKSKILYQKCTLPSLIWLAGSTTAMPADSKLSALGPKMRCSIWKGLPLPWRNIRAKRILPGHMLIQAAKQWNMIKSNETTWNYEMPLLPYSRKHRAFKNNRRDISAFLNEVWAIPQHTPCNVM